MFGYSFDRPASYMEEYLQALARCCAASRPTPTPIGSPRTSSSTSPSPAPPGLLVAALGERMLRLAADHRRRHRTWMTGADDPRASTPSRPCAPPPVAQTNGSSPPCRWRSPTTPGPRPARGPRRPSPSTATFPPTGRCSTAKVPPARRTWPSSATRRRDRADQGDVRVRGHRVRGGPLLRRRRSPPDPRRPHQLL